MFNYPTFILIGSIMIVILLNLPLNLLSNECSSFLYNDLSNSLVSLPIFTSLILLFSILYLSLTRFKKWGVKLPNFTFNL